MNPLIPITSAVAQLEDQLVKLWFQPNVITCGRGAPCRQGPTPNGVGREQDAGSLREDHLLHDHGHVDLPSQQHGTRPYSPAAETVAVGDRTRPWEDPLAAVGTIRDHGNLQVAMLHADEDPEHRRRAIVDLDESEVMGRGSLARTIGKS